MRQMCLHPSFKPVDQFGGELLKGKRKVARPIVTKRAMHTTLRSELAKGLQSFLMPENASFIRMLLKTLSSRFGIQVYEYSINSTHIHLLTRAKTREGYKSFLRAFTGAIAMKITGAKKGMALIKKFWSTRPWSRIISWGSSFFTAKDYVIKNRMESAGIIPYTARKYAKPIIASATSPP